MSILKCLKPKISKGIYDELAKLHAEYMKDFANNTARADAELMTFVTNMEASVKKSRILSAVKISELTAEATKNLNANVAKYKKYGKTRAGFLKFMRADPKWHRELKEVAYKRADVIADGMFLDIMNRMPRLQELMAKTMNNAEVQTTLARGLIDGPGVTTDPLIRDAIVEVRKILDWEAPAMRAAGLAVGDIPSYAPVIHNADAIINAMPKAQWINRMVELSDLSQVYDLARWKKGVTEERFREILDTVYDTLENGDQARAARALKRGVVTSQKPGVSDLFARRINYRIFHPKNADAYVEQIKEMGSGESNVYNMLAHHFRATSRDLAVAEVLGPRPNTFHAHMRTVAEREGANKNELQMLDGEFRTLLNQWDGSIDSILSKTVQNLQKLHSASLLGGAGISAISDQAFVANTRRLFKLIDGGGNFSAFLHGFSGTAQDALDGAHMAEFMARHVMNRHDASANDPFERGVNAAFTNVKDWNHRLSGLNKMTSIAGDQATIITFGALGQYVRKGVKYADLGDLQPMFIRSGIGENEWQRLLDWGIDNEYGFLSPNALPDEMRDVAIRLNALNMEIRRFATNAPDLTLRAVSSGRAFGDRARGDAINLGMTSLMQFKSFPVMVWRNHLLPSAVKALDGDVAPLFYTGVQATMLGMIAIQLKELAKGNAPLDMEDPKSWLRAGVQGGFMGLVGDMVLKDPEQYGRNLAAELSIGPVPASMSTLGLELLKTAWTGEVDGPAFTRALRPLVPFHSLWYLRAGFDKGLSDSLNVMLEDDYYASMERRRNRMVEERGELGWWPAGMKPSFN